MQIVNIKIVEVKKVRCLQFLGHGGGQVVSMLAVISDDPSSNPAASTAFILLSCARGTKRNENEAGMPHFKNHS